ncbi:MAG: primosomal protein N' [Candidatus Limnocylindrales bacterium]
MDLGLLSATTGSRPPADGTRHVEVAIDAAGAGGARSYTYMVPPDLADIEPGEAVLVEFGRRQALAIVLGDADVPAGVAIKSVVARIRTDGRLLPPLTLALARHIAAHYLAPPALVIRSMLPPGLLERLELVAERTPREIEAWVEGSSRDRLDPADLDLLEQLAAGARPARRPGRAGWPGRSAAPASGARGGRSRDARLDAFRRVQWATLRALGPIVRGWPGRHANPRRRRIRRGRPLGPRQVEALRLLAAAGPEGLAASELREGPGTSVLPGLFRRGLVEAEVRERPRRPLAERAPGLRGGRPASSELSGPQAEAVARILTCLSARDPRPLLLDGVTGGGKTAIYIEAIAECLRGGRAALVLVPEIALALPLVDRLRADLDARVALVHSGLADGERADEWRRIRSGDVDIVVGTRLAVGAPLADVGLVIVDEEHDPAYKSDRTPRLQARDVAVRLGTLAGAAVVLGSATPGLDTYGSALEGRYDRVVLPSRPVGVAPAVSVVDLRAELAEGHRGLLSRPLDDALSALDPTVGEQAILVLNRRGTASVVLCRDCGHVQACPDCERPLVYHQAGTSLRCHHCGRATPPATRCPACTSPGSDTWEAARNGSSARSGSCTRRSGWLAWTVTSRIARAPPRGSSIPSRRARRTS